MDIIRAIDLAFAVIAEENIDEDAVVTAFETGADQGVDEDDATDEGIEEAYGRMTMFYLNKPKFIVDNASDKRAGTLWPRIASIGQAPVAAVQPVISPTAAPTTPQPQQTPPPTTTPPARVRGLGVSAESAMGTASRPDRASPTQPRPSESSADPVESREDRRERLRDERLIAKEKRQLKERIRVLKEKRKDDKIREARAIAKEIRVAAQKSADRLESERIRKLADKDREKQEKKRLKEEETKEEKRQKKVEQETKDAARQQLLKAPRVQRWCHDNISKLVKSYRRAIVKQFKLKRRGEASADAQIEVYRTQADLLVRGSFGGTLENRYLGLFIRGLLRALAKNEDLTDPIKHKAHWETGVVPDKIW